MIRYLLTVMKLLDVKSGGGRGQIAWGLLLLLAVTAAGVNGSPMAVAKAEAEAEPMDTSMAEKDAGKSWKGPGPASPLSPPIVFKSDSPSNTDGISPRVAMRKLNRNTTLIVTEGDVKGQRPGLRPVSFVPVEDDSTKHIRITRSANGGGRGMEYGNGNGNSNGSRNPNHQHVRHQPHHQQHNMYKRSAEAAQASKVKPSVPAANAPGQSKQPKEEAGSAGNGQTKLCRHTRGIDVRGSYNGSRLLGWSANKNKNNETLPDCKFIPEQFFTSDVETKQFAAAAGGAEAKGNGAVEREIAATALSAKAGPQEVIPILPEALRIRRDAADGKKPAPESGTTPLPAGTSSKGPPLAAGNATTPAGNNGTTTKMTTTTAKPTTPARKSGARLFSANK